jgi:hypothetical protein
VRSVSGADGWEVVAALADSYAQAEEMEAARALLILALEDQEMAEPARRLLASLAGRSEGPERKP